MTHPQVQATTWGPGWQGYNSSLSLQANLRARFSCDSFDVIFVKLGALTGETTDLGDVFTQWVRPCQVDSSIGSMLAPTTRVHQTCLLVIRYPRRPSSYAPCSTPSSSSSRIVWCILGACVVCKLHSAQSLHPNPLVRPRWPDWAETWS